jgi:hypothetical protein
MSTIRLSYELWNALLADHFFGDAVHQARLVFHVDPDVLHLAAQSSGVCFSEPDDAAADFVAAVRKELRQRHPDIAWSPQMGRKKDTLPRFFGLIAIQVLAVNMMKDDEAGSGKAYWIRLAKLLGRADEHVAVQNEVRSQQIELWRGHYGFASWVNKTVGGGRSVLRLPPDVGHRYTRLPLSQAVLRRYDLVLLEEAFRRLSWQAGQRLDVQAIQSSLCASDMPTAHGRRVWSDEGRQYLAARQIRDYLEVDYAPASSVVQKQRRQLHRRNTLAWLYLDSTGGLKGGVLLDAGSDHAQPEELALGRLLSLSGNVTSDQKREFAYQPLRKKRLLAVYGAVLPRYYTESAFARPGDRILLLAPVKGLGDWRRQLDHISDPSAERFIGIGGTDGALPEVAALPPGWACIQLTIRSDLDAHSLQDPWSSLVRAGFRIELHGGLKLAHRSWMADAGPSVRISSTRLTDHVFVNGDLVKVDEEGRVQAKFDGVGQYTIVSEFAHRASFSVVQPSISSKAYENSAGHVWTPPWPAPQSTSEDHDHVRGPLVVGAWASEDFAKQFISLARAARLPLANREGLSARADHPLVRAMAQRIGLLVGGHD